MAILYNRKAHVVEVRIVAIAKIGPTTWVPYEAFGRG